MMTIRICFTSTPAIIASSILYENSSHPQIKAGEFYLALFNDVQIFEQNVRVLGIFSQKTRRLI
jgi:ribosomal 30S subunit maturation factor RimM